MVQYSVYIIVWHGVMVVVVVVVVVAAVAAAVCVCVCVCVCDKYNGPTFVVLDIL